MKILQFLKGVLRFILGGIFIFPLLLFCGILDLLWIVFCLLWEILSLLLKAIWLLPYALLRAPGPIATTYYGYFFRDSVIKATRRARRKRNSDDKKPSVSYRKIFTTYFGKRNPI